MKFSNLSPRKIDRESKERERIYHLRRFLPDVLAEELLADEELVNG